MEFLTWICHAGGVDHDENIEFKEIFEWRRLALYKKEFLAIFII